MEKITAMKVRLLVDGGQAKDVTLSWPSDAQWIKRQRARKVLIKDLGRGQSETDVVGGEEADLALVQSLTDDVLNITAAQATVLLNQLSQVQIQDVSRDEDERFVAKMRICGGTVVDVTLKAPTADQAMSYKRSYVRVIDLPFNKQEIRTNLEVAAQLFDELTMDDKTSFAIIHKVPVISAVIAELDRLLEPYNDETP